jgi:glycosyltransferase involved in cell wall biosynthesis
MSENSKELPDVCVVTIRGGATRQNATYLLLNVLSELTSVSLVTVALSDDSEIQDEYDVTEISQGSMGGSLLSTIYLFVLNQIRMCREIHRAEEDVIYFFGGTAYVVPVLYSKITRKIVVVQPRGDVPLTLRLNWEEEYPQLVARSLAGVVRLLELFTAVLSDRIVTYTPAMAEELGLGRFEDKLYPDGTRYIKTEEFKPTVAYDERPRRVGMVGRLDVEKGVEELARAVKKVSEETELVFVGDGELRDWMEEELREEIREGRVDITGWVGHEEIPDYLNSMRLLILASEPTEGLPTAIQESFACGTPVYATPVSGVPDVVIEGETGFLMNDKEPRKIADDIEGILSRDDLDVISQNCRKFAIEKYSFDASVERFRTLLSNLT